MAMATYLTYKDMRELHFLTNWVQSCIGYYTGTSMKLNNNAMYQMWRGRDATKRPGCTTNIQIRDYMETLSTQNHTYVYGNHMVGDYGQLTWYLELLDESHFQGKHGTVMPLKRSLESQKLIRYLENDRDEDDKISRRNQQNNQRHKSKQDPKHHTKTQGPRIYQQETQKDTKPQQNKGGKQKGGQKGQRQPLQQQKTRTVQRKQFESPKEQQRQQTYQNNKAHKQQQVNKQGAKQQKQINNSVEVNRTGVTKRNKHTRKQHLFDKASSNSKQQEVFLYKTSDKDLLSQNSYKLGSVHSSRREYKQKTSKQNKDQCKKINQRSQSVQQSVDKQTQKSGRTQIRRVKQRINLDIVKTIDKLTIDGSYDIQVELLDKLLPKIGNSAQMILDKSKDPEKKEQTQGYQQLKQTYAQLKEYKQALQNNHIKEATKIVGLLGNMQLQYCAQDQLPAERDKSDVEIIITSKSFDTRCLSYKHFHEFILIDDNFEHQLKTKLDESIKHERFIILLNFEDSIAKKKLHTVTKIAVDFISKSSELKVKLCLNNGGSLIVSEDQKMRRKQHQESLMQQQNKDSQIIKQSLPQQQQGIVLKQNQQDKLDIQETVMTQSQQVKQIITTNQAEQRFFFNQDSDIPSETELSLIQSSNQDDQQRNDQEQSSHGRQDSQSQVSSLSSNSSDQQSNSSHQSASTQLAHLKKLKEENSKIVFKRSQHLQSLKKIQSDMDYNLQLPSENGSCYQGSFEGEIIDWYSKQKHLPINSRTKLSLANMQKIAQRLPPNTFTFDNKSRTFKPIDNQKAWDFIKDNKLRHVGKIQDLDFNAFTGQFELDWLDKDHNLKLAAKLAKINMSRLSATESKLGMKITDTYDNMTNHRTAAETRRLMVLQMHDYCRKISAKHGKENVEIVVIGAEVKRELSLARYASKTYFMVYDDEHGNVTKEKLDKVQDFQEEMYIMMGSVNEWNFMSMPNKSQDKIRLWVMSNSSYYLNVERLMEFLQDGDRLLVAAHLFGAQLPYYMMEQGMASTMAQVTSTKVHMQVKGDSQSYKHQVTNLANYFSYKSYGMTIQETESTDPTVTGSLSIKVYKASAMVDQLHKGISNPVVAYDSRNKQMVMRNLELTSVNKQGTMIKLPAPRTSQQPDQYMQPTCQQHVIFMDTRANSKTNGQPVIVTPHQQVAYASETLTNGSITKNVKQQYSTGELQCDGDALRLNLLSRQLNVMSIDIDYNDLIPIYSQDKTWYRFFTNSEAIDHLNKYIRFMIKTQRQFGVVDSAFDNNARKTYAIKGKIINLTNYNPLGKFFSRGQHEKEMTMNDVWAETPGHQTLNRKMAYYAAHQVALQIFVGTMNDTDYHFRVFQDLYHYAMGGQYESKDIFGIHLINREKYPLNADNPWNYIQHLLGGQPDLVKTNYRAKFIVSENPTSRAIQWYTYLAQQRIDYESCRRQLCQTEYNQYLLAKQTNESFKTTIPLIQFNKIECSDSNVPNVPVAPRDSNYLTYSMLYGIDVSQIDKKAQTENIKAIEELIKRMEQKLDNCKSAEERQAYLDENVLQDIPKNCRKLIVQQLKKQRQHFDIDHTQQHEEKPIVSTAQLMGRIAGNRAKLDFSYCASNVNDILNKFLDMVKAQEVQDDKYEYIKITIIPRLNNDRYKRLLQPALDGELGHMNILSKKPITRLESDHVGYCKIINDYANNKSSIATNDLHLVYMLLDTWAGDTLFVDNESCTDHGVNCLTIQNSEGDTIVFHGPNVYVEQLYVYDMLDSNANYCVHYGGNTIEHLYPNRVDYQMTQPYQSGYTNSRDLLGLNKTVTAHGLSEQKDDFNNYHSYCKGTYEKNKIHYAIQDVHILREAYYKDVHLSDSAHTITAGNLLLSLNDNQVKNHNFNSILTQYRRIVPQRTNYKTNITWCEGRYCRNMILQQDTINTMLMQHTGRKMVIVDVGSGDSKAECVTTALYDAIYYQLGEDPETYMKDKNFNFKGLQSIAMEGGVGLETISKFVAESTLQLKVWTNITPDGSVPSTCLDQKFSKGQIQLFMTGGHMYSIRPNNDGNYSETKVDCDCEMCQEITIMSYIKSLRYKLLCMAYSMVKRQGLNYTPTVNIGGLTVVGNDDVITSKIKKEAIKNSQVINRLYDETPVRPVRYERIDGYSKLYSTHCQKAPFPMIRYNRTQYVTNLNQQRLTKCSDNKGVHIQIAPVAGNVKYDVQCPCGLNTLQAGVQRTQYSKQQQNPEKVEELMEFVNMYLEKILERDYEISALYEDPQALFEKVLYNIKNSGVTQGAKNKREHKWRAAFDNVVTMKNSTGGFIKVETLTGDVRIGRLISARTEILRDLGGPLSDAIQHQLYMKVPTMVKGLTQEQIANKLIEMGNKGTEFLEMDYGSFDAAQTLRFAMIEKKAAQLVGGDKLAEIWHAIAIGKMNVKMEGCNLMGGHSRNSGEKSTSWGNTLLTNMLLIYPCYMMLCDMKHQEVLKLLDNLHDPHEVFEKLFGRENKDNAIIVEGDDSLMREAYYGKHSLSEVCLQVVQQLGFKTEYDKHSQASGSKFCQIKIEQDKTGQLFACKPFFRSWTKLGWTHKNFKKDSESAHVLLQCKLSSLIHQYYKHPKVIQLAVAIQSLLPKKRQCIDFEKDKALKCMTKIVKMTRDLNLEVDQNKTIKSKFRNYNELINKQGFLDYFSDKYATRIDEMIERIKQEGLYAEINLTEEEILESNPASKRPVYHKDYCRGENALLRHSIGDPCLQNKSQIINRIKGKSYDYYNQSMIQISSTKTLLYHAELNMIFIYIYSLKVNLHTMSENTVQGIREVMLKEINDISPQGTLKDNTTYVQLIEVQNQTDNSKFEAPGLVLINKDEIAAVQGILKQLAEKGVIAAIAKDYFIDMKNFDRQVARRTAKPLTSHNDKLGFDFNIPLNSYVVSYGQQFSESQYRNFLDQAVIFYSENSSLQSHYKQAAKQFTSPRATVLKGKVQAEYQPSGTFARKVKQLEDDNTKLMLQLRQTQADAQSKDLEHCRMMQEYKNGVNANMQRLKCVPGQLRNLLKRYRDELQDQANHQYARALLDPFFYDTKGVRVPQLLPQETGTTSVFASQNVTITHPDKGPTVLWGNMDTYKANPYYIFNPTASVSTDFLNAEPVQKPGESYIIEPHDNLDGADPSTYNQTEVNYPLLETDLTIKQFLQICKPLQWSFSEDRFSKQRTVAAGLRVFKTSRLENESGVMEVQYGQRGMHYLSGTKWDNELGRPGRGKRKLYIHSVDTQQSETDCYKAGFAVMSTFRPQTEDETTNLSDQRYTNNTEQMPWFSHCYPADSQPTQLAAKGQGQFFGTFHDSNLMLAVDDALGGKRIVVPYEVLAEIGQTYGDSKKVYIVLNTLDRNHSVMQKITGAQAGSSFEYEAIHHYEGLLVQEEYGLESTMCMLAQQYTNAIQIQRSMTPQIVFRESAAIKLDIMRQAALMQNQLGIWDETVVPIFKDLLSWGAHKMKSSDIVEDLIEGATDFAAMTLGMAIPEAAPIISAVAPHLKQISQSASETALDQVIKWADSERQ